MTTTCRYFAYGSNMQQATFRGRRGIDIRQAEPARLEGWRIVFDKPPLLPIPESYANIVEDGGGEVYGVLYEIAECDLDHLDLTEGVRIGNYRRIAVPVRLLGSGEAREAFTLTSERRDAALRPSTRYMALLLEGALEHGLPQAWIERLRAVPVDPETPEALRLRALLDDAIRRR
ncbi:MAG: gamma-glutamylcyclotransferase family protein [Candidatus Binatia bacterium]